MLIDFHSHIAPGLDDGAQTLDDSLELARQSVDEGVTHIVATPHGSSHGLAGLLDKREVALTTFQEALSKENIPLTVLPGLEYYADGNSATSALNDPACRCGVPEALGRPILVELPMSLDLSFAGDLLFNAQLRQVPLVLAHPERYNRFKDKLDFLESLMDKGLYLQFNSDDFYTSLFRHSLCNAMLRLIRHNPQQVVIGSDCHRPNWRPAGLSCSQDKITDALGADVWKLVTQDTPAALLGLNIEK
jgi:protein-tyrosine phosphatase